MKIHLVYAVDDYESYFEIHGAYMSIKEAQKVVKNLNNHQNMRGGFRYVVVPVTLSLDNFDVIKLAAELRKKSKHRRKKKKC